MLESSRSLLPLADLGAEKLHGVREFLSPVHHAGFAQNVKEGALVFCSDGLSCPVLELLEFPLFLHIHRPPSTALFGLVDLKNVVVLFDRHLFVGFLAKQVFGQRTDDIPGDAFEQLWLQHLQPLADF